MSVRIRPSAQNKAMPGCVVVARGTLDPLALVRIQARQPVLAIWGKGNSADRGVSEGYNPTER